MFKLVKVEESGALSVFEGTDNAWAVAQGFILKDVEKDYFGNYYLVSEGPKVDLAEVKKVHKERINSWRDSAEQGGFEYLGKMFDSDPISCTRMMGSAITAQTALGRSRSFSISWTCQDNSQILLDAAQLIGLTVALAEHSSRCHAKALELKSLVDSALTVEEVSAITWDTELEKSNEESEEPTGEDSQEEPAEPSNSDTTVNSILDKGE